MHQHRYDNDVKKILMAIAKENKRSFKRIKNLFVVKNDSKITMRFWELVNQQYPNHLFTGVYHCPGCNRFDFEFDEPE